MEPDHSRCMCARSTYAVVWHSLFHHAVCPTCSEKCASLVKSPETFRPGMLHLRLARHLPLRAMALGRTPASGSTTHIGPETAQAWARQAALGAWSLMVRRLMWLGEFFGSQEVRQVPPGFQQGVAAPDYARR